MPSERNLCKLHLFLLHKKTVLQFWLLWLISFQFLFLCALVEKKTNKNNYSCRESVSSIWLIICNQLCIFIVVLCIQKISGSCTWKLEFCIALEQYKTTLIFQHALILHFANCFVSVCQICVHVLYLIVFFDTIQLFYRCNWLCIWNLIHRIRFLLFAPA